MNNKIILTAEILLLINHLSLCKKLQHVGGLQSGNEVAFWIVPNCKDKVLVRRQDLDTHTHKGHYLPICESNKRNSLPITLDQVFKIIFTCLILVLSASDTHQLQNLMKPQL